MNIVVINQPMGNRGDESAHKAFMWQLAKKYPFAKIDMVNFLYNQIHVDDIKVDSPNVKYTVLLGKMRAERIMYLAYKYNLIALLFLNPDTRLLMKRIKEADLIINAPGGICMGGFQNWRHVEQILIAKHFKKPFAYFGRSIGPFPTETESNRLFKRRSLSAIKAFGFVSLRDSKSLEIAQELGINAIPTVDSAFLDSSRINLPIKIREKLDGKKYMVFVPNKLTWHFKFAKYQQSQVDIFYKRIISFILNKDPDLHIVFLPQLHTYSINDDKYYFSTLMEEIKSEHLILIDDIYGSEIQQSIISEAEFVIGARYHSIVFAINQAVPFVSLSYEHKMAGLLETLDINNSIVNIEGIFDNKNDIDKTLREVYTMINNITSEREQNKVWQQKAKKIALNGFKKFTEYVDSINIHE